MSCQISPVCVSYGCRRYLISECVCGFMMALHFVLTQPDVHAPPTYSDVLCCFSPLLSPDAYSSTKIPPHRCSHISALCIIPKHFFCPIVSGATVLLLSLHCDTFQLKLSREICWLVLARLKLVLARLYWQYTGLGVQTRDIISAVHKGGLFNLLLRG